MLWEHTRKIRAERRGEEKIMLEASNVERPPKANLTAPRRRLSEPDAMLTKDKGEDELVAQERVFNSQRGNSLEDKEIHLKALESKLEAWQAELEAKNTRLEALHEQLGSPTDRIEHFLERRPRKPEDRKPWATDPQDEEAHHSAAGNVGAMNNIPARYGPHDSDSGFISDFATGSDVSHYYPRSLQAPAWMATTSTPSSRPRIVPHADLDVMVGMQVHLQPLSAPISVSALCTQRLEPSLVSPSFVKMHGLKPVDAQSDVAESSYDFETPWGRIVSKWSVELELKVLWTRPWGNISFQNSGPDPWPQASDSSITRTIKCIVVDPGRFDWGDFDLIVGQRFLRHAYNVGPDVRLLPHSPQSQFSPGELYGDFYR
jgi:hypothetical protein